MLRKRFHPVLEKLSDLANTPQDLGSPTQGSYSVTAPAPTLLGVRMFLSLVYCSLTLPFWEASFHPKVAFLHIAARVLLLPYL